MCSKSIHYIICDNFCVMINHEVKDDILYMRPMISRIGNSKTDLNYIIVMKIGYLITLDYPT